MGSKFVFGIGLFLVVVSLVASCNWARQKIGQAETNDIGGRSGDADFVRAAVESNTAEIQLAELALTKSADPNLRDIADLLRNDHEQSLQSVLAIARDRKIDVPDLKKVSTDDGLSALSNSGPDFDKRWCAEMIGKHEMTFQILESVWEKTDDDEVRNLVNAALPHLVAHLEALVDYQEHYGLRHPEAVAVSEGNLAGK